MGTLSVDKILKTSTGAAEFTLPATDGAAGTVWQTDGSGQLSVATVGTSGIAALAVDTAQIAADAVGTDQLANDVVISTSGAITTTGAFTSIGIDDNADAVAITIDSAENVGIGTTSPNAPLSVVGDMIGTSQLALTTSATPNFADGYRLNFGPSSGTPGNMLAIVDENGNGDVNNNAFRGLGTTSNYGLGFWAHLSDDIPSTSNHRMYIRGDNGAVHVVGAFSKGSGSFRIDHPLPAKKDTHDLVHSFIEGPNADLIYRGTVDLVSGSATVNIDTAAGMTDGTFVLLCGDIQSFTSNETDWDGVKSSVSGNTLTIECENASSTATISWMVIGARQDDHMKDVNTSWADENGKPIVEPLKES